MTKILARLAVVVLLVLGVQAPAHCAALQRLSPPTESAGHVAALSLNSLAGAATATVRALFVDDANIARAFLKGALGGSVSYLGKRVAVESWTPAPLLGRVINAAGASMVAQASLPTGGVLDSLQIPLGPVSLHFSMRRRPGLSVDVAEAVVLASAFALDDLHFDRDYSLKVLTPVFRTRHTRIQYDGNKLTSGATVGRVIVLDGLLRTKGDTAFAHEVVHLLQHDFQQVAWDQPLERALRSKVPGAEWLPRWLHAGVLVPGLMAIDNGLRDGRGYMFKLKQSEAEWLERHH